ncbi:hypothetical protein [Microbispora sp. H10885]|uniref:hypothetical protein n=1 Tax=Microbispora sp. H10885 TaxID=2729110 RepID=UPI001C719633
MTEKVATGHVGNEPKLINAEIETAETGQAIARLLTLVAMTASIVSRHRQLDRGQRLPVVPCRDAHQILPGRQGVVEGAEGHQGAKGEVGVSASTSFCRWLGLLSGLGLLGPISAVSHTGDGAFVIPPVPAPPLLPGDSHQIGV